MAARVYIGRLSNHARDRDVEKFFKGFGRIRDIMIKNGYCFVVIQLKNLCANFNGIKVAILSLNRNKMHEKVTYWMPLGI